MKIAIDFGGVLSLHDGGSSEHKNTATDMPDAIDVLEWLHANGHELYLVSFCGKQRAIETKESLKSVLRLFRDLYFVKSRLFKKDICHHVGCDILIDDSLDIVQDVAKSNRNLKVLWFTEDTGTKISSDLENVRRVPDWKAIRDFVEKSGNETTKLERERVKNENVASKLAIEKKVYNV